MLMTNPYPTGDGGRHGVRGGISPSSAGGQPTGMHRHDRPTGPETMR